ncbi:MAG TPA: tetratricopeptide repeat protein [Usitatibacter sp.]|nr:tetratricopeptide repeat protein [Usitatibacter sp.]
MTGSRIWWAIFVAAFALALAPVHAQTSDDANDAAEADGDESTSTSDAVFEYLAAEIAAQRGDTEGALEVYQRLARELHDPNIARRAVELAIRARLYPKALESASLLLQLDADATLAREIMAALLANEGDVKKATATLADIIDKAKERAPILMHLSHLFSKFSDKAAVLEATREIAARYEDMAEAHYAIGVAALVASDNDLALKEVDVALARKPAWEQGAILKAQILRKTAPDTVIAFYESFVKEHPATYEVRMHLGRELAAERKLAEARDEFRDAEKLQPRDPQAAYAIGLLSLQLEEFGEAQSAFTRSMKLGYREAAAIYLGMGQASEGLKRYDEAISWYQKVDSGDWVRAQLKIATLISRQQGLAAGREYLQKIEPKNAEDRIQVIQVEAQLLRDAKAWKETYDLLTKAVSDYPDSFELLYDHAMAAERVEKLDVLESDLRKVIKMKPDYAHAYNALGYTLAEKTGRLAEARDLIEKAYKLAPEDPFIQDSLGWVHYRMGEVGVALKHLQQAYSARPDPEIAAHLGEVLWKSGQRDEAQKIWRAALTENPNHETLLTVMQKFRP